MPSSKPGRCQGSQASLWPNSALNSSMRCLPLADAASAIAQSGCRWSTCAKGRKPCSGVSMDAAVGLFAKVDERIHLDHGVLFVDAAILLLQRKQLVEIERSEARALDAAEVTPAALDPEHKLLLAINGLD